MLIGIVERNHTIRRLVQLILEYEHHQVECLEQHWERCNHDVLLIDPGIPHQGIPLLKELEGTPTIILSAHGEYRCPCEAHHLPLQLKPFHLKDLVTLVNVVGARAGGLASCRIPACPRPDGDRSSTS